MQKKQQILGTTLLFITALIWGTAFIAQSMGMDYVSPLTFNALRSLFAVVTLGTFIIIRMIITKQKLTLEQFKRVLIPGIVCGIALTIATNLQQIGIQLSTVGKAGFITSLYIIFVPIIGLVLKQKVRFNIWISVVIALIGFYLLCIGNEEFTISTGDILLLIGSIFFAIQIIVVDKVATKVDGVLLSAVQFLVVFLTTIIPAIITEKPTTTSIGLGLPSIIYAGVLSSGLAYTLQIIGQKNVKPVVASLILSLESVIAALAGVIILHEAFTNRELIGSILLFAAVIFSQLHFKTKTLE